MVTASQYTLRAKGVKTGRTYSVSGYIADVVGTNCKMSTSGLATSSSPDSWRPPEPVMLTDLSVTTGPTVMKALVLEVNGQTTGNVYDIVAHVSTIAQRPDILIAVNQGSDVRLREV